MYRYLENADLVLMTLIWLFLLGCSPDDGSLAAGVRSVARRGDERGTESHREQADHAEPGRTIDPQRANEESERNTFAGKTLHQATQQPADRHGSG
jgi:hypothetical protein